MLSMGDFGRGLFVFVCVGTIQCFIDEVPTGEVDRVANLEAKVQQLEATLNLVNSQLSKICTPTIAFTATLGQTLTNLGDHQTIVFDRVVTNVGNSYNPLSGHVVAPVDGVYAFYVTATNMPHHSVSLQLMKNGQSVDARVLAHGSAGDAGMYVSSSISIVLDLQRGDRVWVQNEGTYSPVEELDGDWSFFSGHQIK